MLFKVVISYVLLLSVGLVNCSRILAIFPVPIRSNQISYRVITQELAKRGHELVIMTTDPAINLESNVNITQIDVSIASYNVYNDLNIAAIRSMKQEKYTVNQYYQMIIHRVVDTQMHHPKMKKLLQDKKEHFDLILLESGVPSILGFSYKFKAPTVIVGVTVGSFRNLEAKGNPIHPVLYPDVDYGSKSFGERWTSFGIYAMNVISYNGIYNLFDEQCKRCFGEQTPHVGELERSTDLMMTVNSHPVLSGIRPLTPNTVLLGCIHIEARMNLPNDIQEYLDKSTNGVVYFSLGSNVKSNQLPAERRQTILEALGELPYNVMWKYEDDTLPGKPQNVLISKWFPQYDMLGHPNIKAFVFQGGQQSFEEAVLSAVPVVGIPFIGDQDKNVKTIVDREIGVYLEIGTLTKESLKEAILEVINNKKYKENIEKLSKIIDDDPLTSRERAVWWIEYVLRHKGAKHLRSPIMDMPFYQYFMLDIFGFIITIILVIIYIIVKIFRHFCPKKKNEKVKKT